MEHLRKLIPILAEKLPPATSYHPNVILMSQDEVLAYLLPFIDEEKFSRAGFTRILMEFGYTLHLRESDNSLCWMIEPDIGIP